MKPPPFLLFAALLFWGGQSNYLIAGAIMGGLLESARFVRWRWELIDSDFNRIWSFCVLLTAALAGYAITTNDAGGGLGGMIHGEPAQAAASASLANTTRFLRWLPLTTFAFILAQTFNMRPTVPVTAVSLVLGWRRRKGDQAFTGYYVNVAYPYFIVCLFAAGIHANTETQTYFWGLAVLAGWALWSLRSRRFGAVHWLAALALVAGLGFLGQFGINQAERVIQNLNAQWMARLFSQRTDPLQSRTSMGRIGELKLSPKIVIWLEPKQIGHAPGYLREASYRYYQPEKLTWFAGGKMSEFELLQSEPDNKSWNLLPGKKGTASVNVACYLNGRSRELDVPEGLLPLPSGCCRVENLPPNTVLKLNRTGALLADGQGLMMFDAIYGPGATLDTPPDAGTNHLDVSVPAGELPALDQIIVELNLTNAGTAQKVLAVEKFFLNKFTYSTWQGRGQQATTNASALTRFLLNSRRGHCEYFATATVLLLRRLGIPARYAAGYAVHETRGSGFIVRERDAHAWCLAWNDPRKGWEDVDTTPPSWVEIETRRTEFMEWFADLKSWVGFQIAQFRWGQAHLQQYIFSALIPVMLVLLYHIIFRKRVREARPAAKAAADVPVLWPGLDSEFYQLEKKLAARGVPRQTGEPLAGWLERALADPALAALRPSLPALLHLHYRHRFDPPGLSGAERSELRRQAAATLEKFSSPAPSS